VAAPVTNLAGTSDSAVYTLSRDVARTDPAGSTDTTTLTRDRVVTASDDTGSTDSITTEHDATLPALDSAGSTDVAAVLRVYGGAYRDLHVLGILDVSNRTVAVDSSRRWNISEAGATTIVEVP
jgi:hypothetical protein